MWTACQLKHWLQRAAKSRLTDMESAKCVCCCVIVIGRPSLFFFFFLNFSGFERESVRNLNVGRYMH
jgi:hypothetical protein